MDILPVAARAYPVTVSVTSPARDSAAPVQFPVPSFQRTVEIDIEQFLSMMATVLQDMNCADAGAVPSPGRLIDLQA